MVWHLDSNDLGLSNIKKMVHTHNLYWKVHIYTCLSKECYLTYIGAFNISNALDYGTVNGKVEDTSNSTLYKVLIFTGLY